MTYRKLTYLAQGKQRDEWNRAAQICWVLAQLQGIDTLTVNHFHAFEMDSAEAASSSGGDSLAVDRDSVRAIGKMLAARKKGYD